MVRAAVIGCGYWGPNLIRNLSALDGVEVALCCDLRQPNLARARALAPSAKCVTDPADVWSSDVSAVAIATPADTHFAMTEAALTAGKDVLVEKPLPAR